MIFQVAYMYNFCINIFYSYGFVLLSRLFYIINPSLIKFTFCFTIYLVISYSSSKWSNQAYFSIDKTISPKVDSWQYWKSTITLTKLFMPYPTRSCAVIEFHTSVVCHVIQREYWNNMIAVDVVAGSRVNFSNPKLLSKNLNHQYVWEKWIIILM